MFNLAQTIYTENALPSMGDWMVEEKKITMRGSAVFEESLSNPQSVFNQKARPSPNNKLVRDMEDKEKERLDYLRDHRTKEQYLFDVMRTQQDEYDAMVWWSRITDIEFTDLREGRGNVKIEDFESISTKADFQTGLGLLDVKTWKYPTPNFWIKKDNIDSYIRQNARILFVMGWGTNNPKWAIINPLEVMSKYKYSTHPSIKKEVYYLNTDDFEWEFEEEDKKVSWCLRYNKRLTKENITEKCLACPDAINPILTDRKLELEDFL